MKIKDLTDETKNFNPITLELTFETKGEAVEFWHRMNAGNARFNDYCKSASNCDGMEKGRLKHTGMSDKCLYEIDNALRKQDIII